MKKKMDYMTLCGFFLGDSNTDDEDDDSDSEDDTNDEYVEDM